jgi:catechol 2,3-dioxygenase
VYITDPDGNDLEFAWDRPMEEWPRDADGHVAGAIDAEFDLEALLAEA